MPQLATMPLSGNGEHRDLSLSDDLRNAKNGAPSIWITKIKMPDGKELKIDTAN